MDNSGSNIDRKVLIVDDNPRNRDLIAAVLDEQELPYDEAENGRQGLDLIEKNDYWLVFMDLLMPGIDGFEAISTIRRKGFNFPIVAVSAISFKQDRQAAFEAGCDFFIPKPVDIELLIEVIDKYREELLRQKSKNQNEGNQEVRSYVSDSAAFNEPKNLDFTAITIFLVEENETIREDFSSILTQADCSVQVFDNGADAWKAINECDVKPGIVISNIHMPEIDGLALLAMVKREYPSILYFLYAPQFDSDTIQLASQQGVDCIVVMESFGETIFDIIEAEYFKKGSPDSRTLSKQALKQVRSAQDKLIHFGCDPPCSFCDIAYTPLMEAGGDMATCRRFNLEGRCGIVLVDVAGHDILSSYLSAVFWGVLSSNWRNYQDPAELSDLLNRELVKLGYHNSHICLTAVLWDPWRRKMKITHAGNPGGMVIREKRGETDFEQLAGGGMVLGLLKENSRVINHELNLSEACSLIFHSDGLESERLMDIFPNSHGTSSPAQRNVSAKSLLDRYLSQYEQTDDMVIVKLNIPSVEEQDTSHFGVRTGFDGVDHACKWLESKLSRGLVPNGLDIFDIMLCVREALLNAVEHGNQLDPDTFMDLSIIPGEAELEIRVSDEGPGFDLETQVEDLADKDGLQVGKRGLLLMNSFAHSIETEGGSVIMKFKARTDS